MAKSKNNNNNNDNNNNDNNNDNNNSNGKSSKGKKKGMARSLVGTTLSTLSKTAKGAKDQVLTEDEFFKTQDRGLVPATKYRDELIAENKKKKLQKELAQRENIIYSKDGEVTYPSLELDAFLNSRRKVKREEFKKLQETEGFYFSKGLDSKELYQMKLDEGLQFIGTNIQSLLDLFAVNINTQNTKGDLLASGKSYELIGEYVDMEDSYDKLLKEKMGYRLSDDKSLMPELVLSEYSTFDEILNESKNYTSNNTKRFSPKSLINMVKILDKYKKTDEQWLRTATAVDIIYKYMSSGMARDDFFSSDIKMDIDGVKELDEFFKTDHIFMTLQELLDYKKALDYYKYNPSTNLI